MMLAESQDTPVKLSPIGAHAPTAGGLLKVTLPYVETVGAETLQIFVSNPRGWALPKDSAALQRDREAFREACTQRRLPLYIHAPLLVNLGSPAPATVERSITVLSFALRRGADLGAEGVVFHAGSAVDPAFYPKAMTQVRQALLPLLDSAAASAGPRLLVEPSAGGGRSLAATVQDLGPYLEAVDGHPWLGVCLDTCHAFAAGHDLAAPGGVTAMLDTLVATVGKDRLRLIHANDSKDGVGSTRDRHETIGAGQIGADAFRELLAHPATAGVPLIVETPSESNGHARDIALLKSLRDTDTATV